MYTEDDEEYRKKHYNSKPSINNYNSDNYYQAYYDNEYNNQNIKKNKKQRDNFFTKIINKFRNLSDTKEFNSQEINHKKHIVIIIILTIVLVILSIVLIQTVFIKHPPTKETTNYVRLLEENLNLKVGDIYKLNLVLSNSNGNYRIEWFSNNDNIATVDSNGTVVALKEGEAIPFLVELGVMSKDGKVLASKYDKFKQINRFLEYIKDITEELIKAKSNDSPLTIIDFGSGKSYLTFAVHYYLSELQHIPVKIYGLDLKKDVIENCTALAAKLGLIGLEFSVGDIATFKNENASKPDLIITLHACDTATDYALNYAIKKGATAILSVPCCQHEINLQLEKQKSNLSKESPLASICHWGLLRERFSSLATDAIRAELLEQSGYSVQILEFIDMTHTPKNIMIRAVKKSSNLISSNSSSATHTESSSCLRTKALLEELQVSQTLFELLKDSQETQK